MKRELLIALRATLATLIVTGIAYPLVTAGAALALFPGRARGSIVTDDSGREAGSELIAQDFRSPSYLHPRPSAVSYDAAGSGGSNLGPSAPALRDRLARAPAGAPPELVTTSASGLDPHLSPAVALWQVPRIAQARGVTPERVQAVIDAHTEGRDLWILGEPRVNVLLVNLALDRHFGSIAAAR